ncbi:MAG: hypothetical protein R3248_05625 [Candidatus Promineifilaceae bacterium]|nr:hypothetical protein [Candidatus Promineifilaceae bacterium]
MKRVRLTLVTLFLMLGAAVLVACGSTESAEPAAAPTEAPTESGTDASTGAASDTGDAPTENNAAGTPKFIEFYAEW